MRVFAPYTREDLIDALHASGARRCGSSWICHLCGEGRRPSLGIYETGDRWRWKCHRCDEGGDLYDLEGHPDRLPDGAVECVDVEIQLRGSAENRTKIHGKNSKNKDENRTKIYEKNPKNKDENLAKKSTVSAPDAKALPEWIASRNIAGRVRWWRYTAIDGMDRAAVLRIDRASGKTYRMARYSGGWEWGRPPGLMPLYRASQVVSDTSAVVVVAEGETSVDALVSAGYTATTSAGGANAYKMTDWTPLRGRRVVVWPDYDEPGRKYAEGVRAVLEAIGCSVLEVDPGALGIDHGGDAADLPVEEVRAAVEGAREPDPLSGLRVCLRTLSEDSPRPIRWLWEGVIPYRMVSLLAGRAGMGKSLALASLAAIVSRGGTLPSRAQCAACGVLYLGREDPYFEVLLPRIRLHAGRMDRIYYSSLQDADSGAMLPLVGSLGDVDAIVRAKDIGWVIVDTLSAFAGQIDQNQAGDVRSVLDPLVALADARGCAITVVDHLRKGQAVGQHGGDPADEILGSGQKTAGVRVATMLDRAMESDRSTRWLRVVKSNFRVPADSWLMSLDDDPDGGDHPVVGWRIAGTEYACGVATIGPGSIAADARVVIAEQGQMGAQGLSRALWSRVRARLPGVRQVDLRAAVDAMRADPGAYGLTVERGARGAVYFDLARERKDA